MLLSFVRDFMHKAHSFANAFRFIDVLHETNNNGLFEKRFTEIYPDELEPKNAFKCF